MSEPLVVVSHSSKDAALVDAFIDLLVAGAGASRARLVCSSVQGSEIPDGQNFVEYLKKKLTRARGVVLVLTPSFYESSFCMCELGATWGLAKDWFPVVAAPSAAPVLEDVLANVQACRIDDPKTLDRLRDWLTAALAHDPGSTPAWNVKRDQFLKRLPALLGDLPKASRIEAAAHQQTIDNYEAALESLADRERALGEVQAQLKAVAALKDRAAVAEVLVDPDEWAKFEAVVDAARRQLGKLPGIVGEALFLEFSGRALAWPGFGEEDRRASMVQAIEDRYLVDRESIATNDKDPTVKAASSAVEQVARFLRGASAEFHAAYVAENEMEATVASRRFWSAHLGSRG